MISGDRPQNGGGQTGLTAWTATFENHQTAGCQRPVHVHTPPDGQLLSYLEGPPWTVFPDSGPQTGPLQSGFNALQDR